MADMLYGGAAYFLGYRIKVNDTEDGYDIVQADGTTPATTTAHASLIVTNYIEQSDYIPGSDGTMKVTLNQYDIAQAMITAVNKFAKKPASSAGTAPAAIKMENGVEQGGGSAASSQPSLVWLGAGPASTEDDTKRLALLGCGLMDPASFPITFKDGQWIKPNIVINSFAPLWALTLPVGLWPSGLFGAVGTVAIPQYEHYVRDYFVKA